jgi:two-component system OmpR family response regulator/two-component system response regulator RstA
VDVSDALPLDATGRVLLVEDDEGLAGLIADYLGRNGLETHWVRRGDAAIEKTQELAPDLLLLDVMLPGQDGFDICRELRARGSTLPIVFLTARDEDFDRVVGLELGADEFIPKPVQPRVLLAHVRAMLRRAAMRAGAPASRNPDTITFGRLEIDVASRAARLGGKPVDLTSSEFDLLWLLARHAGKVLSRNDILNKLRSLDYDGSDRSVDCRIYRLRRKLGDLVDTTERIKTIRNVGYLFSPAHW